jgi:hypothetical protein
MGYLRAGRGLKPRPESRMFVAEKSPVGYALRTFSELSELPLWEGSSLTQGWRVRGAVPYGRIDREPA